MVNDQNQTAVLRFMAALNSSGDLDDLDEVCSPEVAKGWRAAMQGFEFSDRTFTVENLVGDESKVAILWTNTGTHTREYAGIPATGKRTSGRGAAFFTFDGVKITEVVTYYDAEDLLRQLGATISPPE